MSPDYRVSSPLKVSVCSWERTGYTVHAFQRCMCSVISQLLGHFHPQRHSFHCESFRSREEAFLMPRRERGIVHWSCVQKDCELCLKARHRLVCDSWGRANVQMDKEIRKYSQEAA